MRSGSVGCVWAGASLMQRLIWPTRFACMMTATARSSKHPASCSLMYGFAARRSAVPVEEMSRQNMCSKLTLPSCSASWRSLNACRCCFSEGVVPSRETAVARFRSMGRASRTEAASRSRSSARSFNSKRTADVLGPSGARRSANGEKENEVSGADEAIRYRWEEIRY